jgi:hypothetical protein
LKTLSCHSLVCCRSFSSDSSWSIVAATTTLTPEVVNEADEAVIPKEVVVLEESLVEMYLLSEVLFCVLLLLEFGVFGDVRDVL